MVRCVCTCVFFFPLPLYNHLLSVHSETEQEPEEEQAVIDGPGLAGGKSPIWGWFGEQSDVEGEVSQAAPAPPPATPQPSTRCTAHTPRLVAEACLEQMLCGVGLEQLLSLWRRKQAGWCSRYFFPILFSTRHCDLN